MIALAREIGLVACTVLVVVHAVGCSPGAGKDVETSEQSIVYGNDDRVEPYMDPDAALRTAAKGAIALIALRTDVGVSADGAATLASVPLTESQGVCADEPFATQPSAGFCTGVLVAPDLLLTVGHCLALQSCPHLAVIFEYQYDAPGELHRLRREDVFECKEAIAARADETDGDVLDFGFIRLDRPTAAPLTPVRVTATIDDVSSGSEVALIGHGAGLPTKIARHGTVTDARTDTRDYFVATVDNFEGGSGGGVFDTDGRLLGIAARGASDFEPSPAGCVRSRVVPDEAGEEITYLEPAIASLCAAVPGAVAVCPETGGNAGGACSFTPWRESSQSNAGVPALLLIAVVPFARRLRRRERNRLSEPSAPQPCRGKPSA